MRAVKCADCGKSFSKLFLHPYCIECFQKQQNQQKDHTPNGFWEELFGNMNSTSNREYIRMDGEPYFYQSFGKQSSSTAGQQQPKSNSGTYTYLPVEIKEAFKVLGIEPMKDVEAIRKVYKALALVKHPDTGGQHQDMVKLNKAKDVALKWARGR